MLKRIAKLVLFAAAIPILLLTGLYVRRSWIVAFFNTGLLNVDAEIYQ